MNKIPHYKQTRFLTEQIGNNAFDYDIRSETHPEPTIRIAPLIKFPNHKAALKKLRQGLLPAFEIAEDAETKSFHGLENFLQFPNPQNPDSPIFIFDNHNHAFYFWHWYSNSKKQATPLTLIHIDQHKDSRIPAEILSPEDAKDLNKVYEYTNEILNVGNFIPPAFKTGLIDRLYIIDSSTTLSNPFGNDNFIPQEQAYILDIDLDFFAPEMNYLNNTEKFALIRKLLPKAKIVTMATSPYFLKQELAFEILHELFK